MNEIERLKTIRQELAAISGAAIKDARRLKNALKPRTDDCAAAIRSIQSAVELSISEGKKVQGEAHDVDLLPWIANRCAMALKNDEQESAEAV